MVNINGINQLNKTGKFGIIIVAVLLLLMPAILSGDIFVLHVISLIYLNIIILMGLIIILGLSKQFSLGQVAFYGIGAYTTALLTKNLGINFFLALLIAGFTAGLFSIIIAIPGTRFKGPWLALITFAFAEIFRLLMMRLKGVSGGVGGFFGIPKPSIGGFSFYNDFRFYYIFLVMMLVIVFLTIRLKNSPPGKIWTSLGDDENISLSLGINVFLQKIIAFFIGSFFAGIAGSLYAGYANFISPELFTIKHTVFYLTILVVGGLESIQGAIIATVLFTLSQNFLRGLYPWDMIIYGLIMIIIINLMPAGLGKAISELEEKILNRFKSSRKLMMQEPQKIKQGD